MLSTRAEAIHPRPVSAAPIATSALGPNRSTSQPSAGENSVCTTISTEKVICTVGSPAPVAAWNGLTNSVQTYCGLETAIMTTRPSRSWTHLEAAGREGIGHSEQTSRGTKKQAACPTGIVALLDEGQTIWQSTGFREGWPSGLRQRS